MHSESQIEIDLEPGQILQQAQLGGQSVLAGFFKALKKIRDFKSMAQLSQDNGLNWHKLEHKVFPGTKEPVYAFRINDNWRALCLLRKGPVIVIVAVFDHDDAYSS